jgi:hypothetical protein
MAWMICCMSNCLYRVYIRGGSKKHENRWLGCPAISSITSTFLQPRWGQGERYGLFWAHKRLSRNNLSSRTGLMIWSKRKRQVPIIRLRTKLIREARLGSRGATSSNGVVLVRDLGATTKSCLPTRRRQGMAGSRVHTNTHTHAGNAGSGRAARPARHKLLPSLARAVSRAASSLCPAAERSARSCRLCHLIQRFQSIRSDPTSSSAFHATSVLH